jgi:glycosyltransferase involved in cell wall biosynthesis
MFLEWYRQTNADVYLTQYDIWPLNKVPQAAARGEIVWIPWLYMDFPDFPPYMVDKIRPALRAIPTSKWLEGELIKKGLTNITSPVSPGVDLDCYHPMLGEIDSEGKEITKERLRAALGFEDVDCVVGMVQMNQLWRKPFPEQFEGVKIFAENNKDLKIGFYVHSQVRVKDSWDLNALAKDYGLDKLVNLKFADSFEIIKGTQGYGDDRMCKIYNAFDVLLQATGGESPGYPLIEGQACGIPAVGTNCTAIPEFIKAGYTVKVAHYLQSPNLIKKALPDPYDIADKLEKVVKSGPEKWVKPARDFAMQFPWERTYTEMADILEKAEKDIQSICTRIPVPTKAWNVLSTPEVM